MSAGGQYENIFRCKEKWKHLLLSRIEQSHQQLGGSDRVDDAQQGLRNFILHEAARLSIFSQQGAYSCLQANRVSTSGIVDDMTRRV